MRVGNIKQTVQINEEVDPFMHIKQLKEEVKCLKLKLSVLESNSGSSISELTPQDKEYCNEVINQYLSIESGEETTDISVLLDVLKNYSKTIYCFNLLKDKALSITTQLPRISSVSTSDGNKPAMCSDNSLSPTEKQFQEKIAAYQDLVLQKENEINVMFTIIQNQKIKEHGNSKKRITKTSLSYTLSISTRQIDTYQPHSMCQFHI